MKRIAAIAIIGWLLLAGSTWASQVTNVALSYQDGSTVARIDIQGPVRFTHQTEVPKDGRPDRVIVDVLSATHALGAKEFRGLPACVVTGVRSSQYAVSPEKIVRIVFDLSTTPVYQIDSDDKSVTIKFNHKEPKSFAAWSSSDGLAVAVAEKTPSPAIETPRPIPMPAATVAARNDTIEKDRIASLSGETSPKAKTEVPQAKPVQTTPPAAPVAKNADGLAFSDGWNAPQSWKPITPLAFPSAVSQPVSVAKSPEPTKTPAVAVVESKPVEKTPKVAVVDEKPVAKPPVVEQPQVAPVTEQPKLASVIEKPKDVQPVKEPEVKAPETPVSEEPAFPPVEEFAFPPLQAPPASPVMAAKASPVPTTQEAPASVVSEPASPAASAVPGPKLAATTPGATPKPIDMDEDEVASGANVEKTNLLDEADFAPAVELPASVKPEDLSKVVVADAASGQTDKTQQRATSRFRRDVQSDKIRGTMVAEFPERLVIQYQTGNQRDPFDPLIDDDKSFNNPVENRIPNVEGLKLVGILESDAGNNRALFEDKGGFSYILQSGDKVRNGYVLRVEPDQVYFQIFEYGWSRTVALTMEY